MTLEPVKHEETPDSTEDAKPLSETTKNDKIDATKWSKEMNDLFVDLLILESSENCNERNESDWSQGSWQRITHELERAFPLKARVNKFDKTKLKKHLKILKDEHAYWLFLKNRARGFRWDQEKGCFSLDYYGVEEYFAANGQDEDPEVVDRYQKKKSWLKKFCVEHAADYLAKYDKFIVNQASLQSAQSNGVPDRIAEKRKLMFDDDDDDDDDDEEESKPSPGNWDEEDNDLLELTGCAPKKKRKLPLPPVVDFLASVERYKEVLKMVMALVKEKKLSVRDQQVISRLVTTDPILFNYIENPDVSEEEKVSYLKQAVAEYV